MHLFHIATRADWAAARQSGTYTTSTYGRTLAAEGYIHAAHRDQVPKVFREHFRGVREPLVLLTIDTDKLEATWAEQPVGDDSYPHIHGALNADAVRHVSPLNRRGGSESFTTLFVKEMLGRILLAFVVMALISLGVLFGGRYLETEWGPLLGAGAGLLVGIAAVRQLSRWRA